MKKTYFFLFICLLSLCACKIAKGDKTYTTETLEKVPVDPHIPTTEASRENIIGGLKNSISGLSNAYKKMKSWEETTPDFSEGMKKAAKIEETYGARISEITSLTLTDLSEEELESLSTEVLDIVPQIREVNDLFEFHQK